ncbi:MULTISPECIES: acyltransferase family protein [Niastella]|uniref:Acyltransferase family protein n=1 Tax=Niastella soli TaxID=2821487 RepID=A0ABS3YWF3_9BACT|nr:acyltransferase family protein [Niastella soli]MBO9202252.1 acyltransferase family protein [Niastella soli]
MQPVSTRQAYLDWLRIASIMAVFFLHSSMAYVEDWGWHLKNKETSNLLMEVNFWMSRFRMPLLFFISGTVTYFMLKSRTTGSFIGLRFRRLFIPLLFGMLVVVPPQVYMERLTQGFKGNFADFYPSIFTTGAYPKGNLSWHHLWFILYLFLYDIIFAPAFKWSMSDRGKQRLAFFNNLATGKRIYLLLVPSVIIYTAMNLSFPETHDLIHDWGRHIYWIFFLLTGFTCINFPALMDSLERNRRTSFLLAFATILIINYIRWNNLEPDDIFPNWRHDWRMYAYMLLFPLTAWGWIFTAIGYAKRYLNKKHRIQNYINEAVYPFYILHQTIIVIVVFYVIRTSEPVLNKFLFTFITSFILVLCIYHLFIRPYSVTRFLFGMKPKKKATRPTETTVEKSAETIQPAIQLS